MICPYAVNRKVITRSQIQYDEEGKQTAWVEAQTNSAEFVQCQKENCAAFQDGKCCYKAN